MIYYLNFTDKYIFYLFTVISTTPIRHKVFSRLGTIQRPDAFRNRLPNTSRPPSLHVDDFVAMETRSVRQPRYKLPIQPIQVMLVLCFIGCF